MLQGDAADLSFLPDSSVELVVTSPPYPMIQMWDDLFRFRNPEIARALDAADGLGAFELMHSDLHRAWTEIHRVLAQGGWACVNIGDATRTLNGRFRLYPNAARVISAFVSLGFDILPEVLWRKQTNAPNKFMGSGMLPAGAYVTLEHEHILVMRKGAGRTFRTSDQKIARRKSAIFWEERNTWYSDIWDFKGVRQALPGLEMRERSAAFPFELPFRLISMYSVQGDTVLDPFVGTGTTLLAAMACNRNSIGVDTDSSVIATGKALAARAAPSLNHFIRHRFASHLAFIEKRSADRRMPGHANRPHGFPVMTSQEEGLCLQFVEGIRSRQDGSIAVSYREEQRRDSWTLDQDSPTLF